jgi:beta-lactam-binding protein with PASTA domain
MQVITREVASSQPVGAIAYTTPEFGTPVPKGSIVKVFISSGGKIVVPNIAGMDYTNAFATLQELGLTPSFPQPSQMSLNSRCDPIWPNDLAIGTSPAVGTEVSNASAILVIPNKCG